MHRKPSKKWWGAYRGLYGEQADLIEPTKAAKPKPDKPALPTEQQEQFVAVAWLRKMNIPHHHSPNGGYRDYREAAKFKRLGTSAGFPDIFIPKARKGYHGLYIELKRVSGGKLSEAQEWWRDLLLAEGYAWHEAKGATEFIQFVENYLK